MGKIIDISSKIKNEPTFLHIAENMSYKVDDSKNTVIKVMAVWDNDELGDMDKIDKTIEMILGKKAFKEINDLNLSINDYKTVSMAIMATITGQSLEEFETRFQQSTEK
jgi:hypothetical protein